MKNLLMILAVALGTTIMVSAQTTPAKTTPAQTTPTKEVKTTKKEAKKAHHTATGKVTNATTTAAQPAATKK